jgi:molybdate transport system substrate-binding protein
VKSMHRIVGLSAALVLAGLAWAAFSTNAAAAESEVVVFAAASSTNAITEIAELYAARSQGRVTPSFASSSALARQIENGAPADVFLSADEKWMNYLEEKNLLVKGSRYDLLNNRIVLIAPRESALQRIKVKSGVSLSAALGKDGRLSMGDPDYVPAGIYGKQALQALSIWDPIKNRIAPMKDVRAALVMVERGEAPLGLVYATDAAISKKVRVVGVFPADSHAPIVYPVAVVAGGQTAAAARFMDFLRTPEARAVFEKYGFGVR